MQENNLNQEGQGPNVTAENVPPQAETPAVPSVNETPGQVPQEEKKVDEKIIEGMQNLAKPAPNQPNVSSDDKLWGFISYLPLIGPILALIMKPESEYIKLHGRQGLLIFIFFFFNIFIYLFPYIGPFLGIIVHFSLLILAVYSMYQALIGNWWKIPVFGEISEMIPTDLFVKVTREAVMGPEKIEKNQATLDQDVPNEGATSPLNEDVKTDEVSSVKSTPEAQEPQNPIPNQE